MSKGREGGFTQLAIYSKSRLGSTKGEIVIFRRGREVRFLVDGSVAFQELLLLFLVRDVLL